MASFSLLVSVMQHDVRRGRAKVTLMTLIWRLKETTFVCVYGPRLKRLQVSVGRKGLGILLLHTYFYGIQSIVRVNTYTQRNRSTILVKTTDLNKAFMQD